ncbi:hypothetical protein FH972_023341 [Carpinus fangiana]|uniref:Telomere-associated protein Rif1 N-terminal domain-containing protein n=1 Tax=Carpinus fangiana TaxID=176857 RepID=A0A5N6KVB4_9ROSI|nr:hypothetical protein FH972_023341 [Carpinus fangiana]
MASSVVMDDWSVWAYFATRSDEHVDICVWCCNASITYRAGEHDVDSIVTPQQLRQASDTINECIVASRPAARLPALQIASSSPSESVRRPTSTARCLTLLLLHAAAVRHGRLLDPPSAMNISPPASSQPRPPTPPKERALDQTLDHFIHFLDSSSRLDTAPPTAAFDTPPPSSSPLSASPTRAGAKKIRFVAQPSLIDSPDTFSLHEPAPLRPLPPSSHQRSYRSILKACDTTSPPPSSDNADSSLANASLSDFNTFTDMLQAVTRGLSSTTYTSRIDAYQLLLKCFRQYRKIPDPQALLAQLPVLERVLQRDMVAISPATEGPDTKLIGQATRVLANLFWDAKTSANLTQAFIDFVMERSITVAEAPKLPKEVVKNQLFLLTLDRFLSRAITPSRASRIITALTTIHERVSGDHILAIRLTVLQQFIRLAPTTLTSQVADWLPWIFNGIMSNSTELRSSAIATGAVCSTELGTYRQVSAAAREYFEQENVDNEKNFDLLYRHLEVVMEDVYEASRVPAVWSIVVFFLRGSQQALASWPRLNHWFKVIQTCLNKNNHKLNLEAWISWNNFIFAVNPSLTTQPYMRKILIKPIISKLQVSARTEHALRIRHAAFSSFSLLLYYTFRPGCTSDHITLYWSEFVMEIVQNVRMTSVKDFKHLCDILCALLGNTDAGVWDLNRYAPSCETPVKVHEIPRIDPTWTRANIDITTELVEHFVAMQLPLKGNHDFAQRICQTLLEAVVEAGKREIKPSTELKRSVAEMLNLFARLTRRIMVGNIRTHLNTVDSALRCISDLACATASLKPINLADKSVIRSENGTFGVAQSPGKSRSEHSEFQIPLVALLQMIQPLVQAATAPSEALKALTDLTSACVNSLSTRKTKLTLIKMCANAICGTSEPQPNPRSQPTLWGSIAQLLRSNLEDSQVTDSAHEKGQSLYHDYQTCMSVVKNGLRLTDQQDCQSLAALVSALVSTAKAEAGDAAALVSIVAPLSLAIICSSPNESLNASMVTAAAMLQAPLFAPSHRAIDSAARSMLPHGESPTNWSFALFHMTNRLLDAAAKGTAVREPALVSFLTTLAAFPSSGLCAEPKELLIQCHTGLSQCAVEADSLPPQFVQLWRRFMQILTKYITKDSRSLAVHEILFVAGFTSDSRRIARLTIDTWNSTFGVVDDISYSDRLSLLLDQLKSVAHVVCKARTDSADPSSHAVDNLVTFPWTTKDADDETLEPPTYRPSPAPQTKLLSQQLGALRALPAFLRSPLLPIKEQALPRLRHDDSQVDFVPIESAPNEAEGDGSQHLTEHQMEVRSRQETDGMLFAEIQSSPQSGKITAEETSVTPGRRLDFGHHSQQSTPLLQNTTKSLHEEPIEDNEDVLPSPSQQRSERRACLDANTIGSFLARSQDDAPEAEQADTQPVAQDPEQRIGSATVAKGSGNHQDFNYVEDSFPTPLTSPAQMVMDSFVGQYPVKQEAKVPIMTSQRASRHVLDRVSSPTPCKQLLGKRRGSLAPESQNKRKTNEILHEKVPKNRHEFDRSDEVTIPSPPDKHSDITVQSSSEQIGEARSSQPPLSDAKKSQQINALVRKPDRRRTRSQMAPSLDEEAFSRPKKIIRTAEEVDISRRERCFQPRKSRRLAGENAPASEEDQDRSEVRATRTEKEHILRAKPVRVATRSTLEANPDPLIPITDSITAAQAEVELNEAEKRSGQDSPIGQAVSGSEANANGSSDMKSEDGAVEVRASTPILRRSQSDQGTQSSPPSRPVFSPNMSEKARIFLDSMKEMYRQCKAMVLGQEDEAIMDEMEDVADNIKREIGRAGRRGGLKSQARGQRLD